VTSEAQASGYFSRVYSSRGGALLRSFEGTLMGISPDSQYLVYTPYPNSPQLFSMRVQDGSTKQLGTDKAPVMEVDFIYGARLLVFSRNIEDSAGGRFDSIYTTSYKTTEAFHSVARSAGGACDSGYHDYQMNLWSPFNWHSTDRATAYAFSVNNEIFYVRREACAKPGTSSLSLKWAFIRHNLSNGNEEVVRSSQVVSEDSEFAGVEGVAPAQWISISNNEHYLMFKNASYQGGQVFLYSVEQRKSSENIIFPSK